MRAITAMPSTVTITLQLILIIILVCMIAMGLASKRTTLLEVAVIGLAGILIGSTSLGARVNELFAHLPTVATIAHR